jgi:hypothetical protein
MKVDGSIPETLLLALRLATPESPATRQLLISKQHGDNNMELAGIRSPRRRISRVLGRARMAAFL